jgi:hypothetical protein
MRIERAKLRDETTSQAEVAAFFTTVVRIQSHRNYPHWFAQQASASVAHRVLNLPARVTVCFAMLIAYLRVCCRVCMLPTSPVKEFGLERALSLTSNIRRFAISGQATNLGCHCFIIAAGYHIAQSGHFEVIRLFRTAQGLAAVGAGPHAHSLWPEVCVSCRLCNLHIISRQATAYLDLASLHQHSVCTPC